MYAVNSDLVHIEQLHPPGLQFFQGCFKYNFQTKLHPNCPEEGSWNGQISHTYELMTKPVLRHCDKNKKIRFGIASVLKDSSFQKLVGHIPTPRQMLQFLYIPNYPFNILHLFLQLIINPTRNVGQGNIYSKLSQKIISDRTSIKKLTSRSLTGQGHQMQIHQHTSWLKLDLVWNVINNGKNDRDV